ncbi:hypothetical protein Pcinc_028415 [Petrolisthes cinctipes]|uniref:Uncharacterized protein n=1 Tax=Petrolisthes cinctipes TaxID=88211 RepID=A0AAE1F2E7_PETCI|nr:hypothetical protein Pcinc_028415 [Petrolisthes cinctipes]
MNLDVLVRQENSGVKATFGCGGVEGEGKGREEVMEGWESGMEGLNDRKKVERKDSLSRGLRPLRFSPRGPPKLSRGQVGEGKKNRRSNPCNTHTSCPHLLLPLLELPDYSSYPITGLVSGEPSSGRDLTSFPGGATVTPRPR